MEAVTLKSRNLSESEKLPVLDRLASNGEIDFLDRLLRGSFSDLAESPSDATREQYFGYVEIAWQGVKSKRSGAEARC